MPGARAKDGRNRGARGVRRALFGALVELVALLELAFPALMLLQPGPAFSASDPAVREGAAASDDAPAAVSAASFNLSEVRAMRFREDRNAPAQSFTADGPPGGGEGFASAGEAASDRRAGRSAGASGAQSARPGDFVFAIEETGTNETYLRAFRPLAQGLRIAFPDRRVLVRVLPSRGFAEAVRAERIPFVIATAGTMVTLMDTAGAMPLAARERSVREPAGVADGDRSTAAAGGLLIVDAARKDLSNLASLKGARVAVESSVAFGPWQWLAGRLIAEGIDPKGYFTAVWRPYDVPDVFNAVASGRADAGLVSLCAWERLVREGFLDASAFRPAAELPGRPGACRSSTPILPDWTLGYLPAAESGAVRRVAAVAFSVPENEDGRWGTRVDLSEVRAVMADLHWGPYAYLDEQSLTGFVRNHSEAFLALLALFVFMAFHALRSRHLVRVRTRDLEAALEEKNRMEQEARVSRERLSAIERVGLLSQMSSMFAHELKQPLSSLSNYIGGLSLWNDRRRAPEPERAMTREVLSAMSEETSRITSIVNRVRGYARRSTEPLRPCDLAVIIRRAILIVERHDARRAPIMVAPGALLAADPADDRPARVLGDPLELELLVLNLIRNACHAACATGPDGLPRDGFVSVSLAREDGSGDERGVGGAGRGASGMPEGSGNSGNSARLVLHVTDNGPRLSAEGFARLTGYGDSVKQEGLGIGLSICRGIADRHGAALHFYQLPREGVCAEVTIEELEVNPEGPGAAGATEDAEAAGSAGSSAASGASRRTDKNEIKGERR